MPLRAASSISLILRIRPGFNTTQSRCCFKFHHWHRVFNGLYTSGRWALRSSPLPHPPVFGSRIKYSIKQDLQDQNLWHPSSIKTYSTRLGWSLKIRLKPSLRRVKHVPMDVRWMFWWNLSDRTGSKLDRTVSAEEMSVHVYQSWLKLPWQEKDVVSPPYNIPCAVSYLMLSRFPQDGSVILPQGQMKGDTWWRYQ